MPRAGPPRSGPPIYLDNHATTRVDPRVVEAMLPYLDVHYGNAASRGHPFGWAAEEAVKIAREQVAALIGAAPREIVFTSGATESDNLAIKGTYRANPGRRRLLISPIEHRAVLDSARALARDEQALIGWLPVEPEGFVRPGAVEAAIDDESLLVSVMHGNNEIGTLTDLAGVGAVCQARGVTLHSDAAQTAGTVPIDVAALGVDLLSISAHKLHGPKGVGALFVRRGRPRARLAPLLHGGGHERGLRSGTLPVHQIVGFGAACELARAALATEPARLADLRDRLYQGIRAGVPDVVLNGHPTRRLPGNLHLSFPGLEGEALLLEMRALAVSSGAACASATLEPSHVLRAVGLDDDLAHASIRFGLGRFNTPEEIEVAITAVIDAVATVRGH